MMKLSAVLITVALSAAGIGLVMPVLPALLTELGAVEGTGWKYGAFLALYAVLQFIFSPLLGVLSDRVGRRPVLLLSLAGAAIDNLFMAMAPALWLLFVGRAIAGVTGASMAVASAYVADLTPEAQRARRFGQLGAAFGIGFIAGPALGGLLGAMSPRAPFLAAAALNGATLVLAAFALRESHIGVPTAGRMDWNPLAPLRWAMGFPALRSLLVVYMVLGLVGEVGGVIWVLYGYDRFGWSPLTVGLSLAGFGLFHALAQAFVAGPVAERWGERRAVIIGIAADTCAYVSIALTSNGVVAFLLLPLFCIGGIGAPALQALLTARVAEDEQGKLQGVLASLASLASIVGPFAISTAYFSTRHMVPGLIWLIGAALYGLCLPALFSRRAFAPERAKTG
ncbi:MAG TPA: TCR/Tet family MFS transporter [Parvibaculum sp.]|jgi:DHA1 family tetracycline resistance protein-like MFS transporter